MLKGGGIMEQKNDAGYAARWLERRNQTETEPDDDFIALLEELSRGPQ